MGTGRVVIKAQVLTGGRGKAGGVKLVNNTEDAYQEAKNILGMSIKGLPVNQVLVSEGSYVFKTLGLGGSEILFVEATETGVIDLSTLLSNFVKEKECSNVTVQLTPGARAAAVAADCPNIIYTGSILIVL